MTQPKEKFPYLLEKEKIKSNSYIHKEKDARICVSRLMLCCILLFAFPLSAQERNGNAGNKNGSSQKNIDTAPLYQFEAQIQARRYARIFRKDVPQLHILVKNYGNEVPNAQKNYEAVKSDYEKALVRFYRREYTWSLKIHQENYKRIKKLYQSFSEKFKVQVFDLLTEVSRKLAERQLTQAEQWGQDIQKVKLSKGFLKSEETSARLRLAYQQNFLAEDMERQDYHQKAVEHYRLAKLFAIRAIWIMEEEPDRQTALEKKYSKDLLDSRGLLVK